MQKAQIAGISGSAAAIAFEDRMVADEKIEG
jgi:hypothetical protein